LSRQYTYASSSGRFWLCEWHVIDSLTYSAASNPFGVTL
jgi:hypothetical protein